MRGYVDFSCLATTCLNTSATVNQSQIGVDTIDTNDLEIEIGNCFMRFEHDVEIREYFCRRFSGYKDNSLNVHYMRPGSNEFENDYQTYPEITLEDGTPTYYRLVDDYTSGLPIYSTYNDADSFVPGDACGFKKPTNPTGQDYFYGLAPGQTSGFVNFPNPHTPLITFGQSAHPSGVDDVDDTQSVNPQANGSANIYGIKFNRSQTPYYLYFGLLPGKTALHKTVGKFFADKINAVTLQGVGASNDDASENTNNQNNLRHEISNPFSIYKTCLGETLIASQTGSGGSGSGPGGPGGTGSGPGSSGSSPVGLGGTSGIANPPGGSGGLTTGPNVNVNLPQLNNYMSTSSGGGQYCGPSNNSLTPNNYECKMGSVFGINHNNTINGSILVTKPNTTLTFLIVNDITATKECKFTGGGLEIFDSNGGTIYINPVNSVTLPPGYGVVDQPPYQVTFNHQSYPSNWQYSETIPLPTGIYTFKLSRFAKVSPVSSIIGCTSNNGRVELILTG